MALMETMEKNISPSSLYLPPLPLVPVLSGSFASLSPLFPSLIVVQATISRSSGTPFLAS